MKAVERRGKVIRDSPIVCKVLDDPSGSGLAPVPPRVRLGVAAFGLGQAFQSGLDQDQ